MSRKRIVVVTILFFAAVGAALYWFLPNGTGTFRFRNHTATAHLIMTGGDRFAKPDAQEPVKFKERLATLAVVLRSKSVLGAVQGRLIDSGVSLDWTGDEAARIEYLLLRIRTEVVANDETPEATFLQVQYRGNDDETALFVLNLIIEELQKQQESMWNDRYQDKIGLVKAALNRNNEERGKLVTDYERLQKEIRSHSTESPEVIEKRVAQNRSIVEAKEYELEPIRTKIRLIEEAGNDRSKQLAVLVAFGLSKPDYDRGIQDLERELERIRKEQPDQNAKILILQERIGHLRCLQNLTLLASDQPESIVAKLSPLLKSMKQRSEEELSRSSGQLAEDESLMGKLIPLLNRSKKIAEEIKDLNKTNGQYQTDIFETELSQMARPRLLVVLPPTLDAAPVKR